MTIETIHDKGKLIRINIKTKLDGKITPDTGEYRQLASCLAVELYTEEIKNINIIKEILGESVKGWCQKDYEEFQQAVIKLNRQQFKEYEERARTLTLTNKQCSTLDFYLLATTQYRKKEAEYWKELAEQKNEDGTIKFKHAAENAVFWQNLIEDLEEIRQIIDVQ